MTKSELIEKVAKEAKLTNTLAKVFVETFLETILETLKTGEEIKIANFGTFVKVTRKGRLGRNPKNGEPVQVPDSETIKFIPSKYRD